MGPRASCARCLIASFADSRVPGVDARTSSGSVAIAAVHGNRLDLGCITKGMGISRKNVNLICRVVATATVVLAPFAMASPAYAAPASIGSNCAGKQVVRCVWFNVDHANNRLRAHSGIWDSEASDAGANYTVATSQIRLQRFVNGNWEYWSGSYRKDYDGWHGSLDRAQGGLVSCSGGSTYTVRAVVHQKWKGASPGSGTQYGPGTTFSC